MADQVPLKLWNEGGANQAPGQMAPGDTTPIEHGGTGASDAATARANLGAATAAQGALADSAVQPGDLGTAAAADIGTAVGQIPALQDVGGGAPGLPAVDASQLTGLPSGVSDHGALTGLADDDHTQYHNDARGDARYDALGAAATVQGNLDSHTGDTSNPHEVTTGKIGAATTAQGAKADSALQSVVAGTNVTVNNTDPQNPIISASVPGGGGDMAASVYDPQNIQHDAFARANHTGTQTLATISDAGTAAASDAADFDTVGAASAVQANLDAHEADNANPHGVTAAQAEAATIAQGALADSALQPGDNVSALINDSGFITAPPSDGNYYAYKDGAWVNITDNLLDA